MHHRPFSEPNRDRLYQGNLARTYKWRRDNDTTSDAHTHNRLGAHFERFHGSIHGVHHSFSSPNQSSVARHSRHPNSHETRGQNRLMLDLCVRVAFERRECGIQLLVANCLDDDDEDETCLKWAFLLVHCFVAPRGSFCARFKSIRITHRRSLPRSLCEPLLLLCAMRMINRIRLHDTLCACCDPMRRQRLSYLVDYIYMVVGIFMAVV